MARFALLRGIFRAVSILPNGGYAYLTSFERPMGDCRLQLNFFPTVKMRLETASSIGA